MQLSTIGNFADGSAQNINLVENDEYRFVKIGLTAAELPLAILLTDRPKT